MSVARGTRTAAPRFRHVLAAFGLPELSLLCFYGAVIVGLLLVQRDARLDFHLALICTLGAAYAGAARLLRAGPAERRPHLRRVSRRLVTIVALFALYFQLRWIIPAFNSHDVDGALNGVDVAVFGAPVAALLAPYQTHFWVEWFSFFYWMYFYVLGAYVFAHLFLDRDGEHFTVLGAGLIMMHAPLGWSWYFALPGFGPYEYLRHVIAPLPGGLFLRMSSTAYSWGPLRDIFPSLHTAVMTFLSLHALSNWRRHVVYRIVSIPLAFWALQIVIATVYCRWHYVVDVAAGLALAALCWFLSRDLSRRWARFRTSAGEVDPWF